MSKSGPDDSSNPKTNGSGSGTVPSPKGMSPYATGGGGVTFERKVAVLYLAHLLVGDNATQLGDGRRVVSVSFQQAPTHSVDDLLISAARPDEAEPSLVLALGVRRSPNLVKSDASTKELVRQFVRAVTDMPTNGPEHRFGLVVSGSPAQAKQLAELAHLAANQMNAAGFFDLVRTAGKFDAALRKRLDHLESLVRCVLEDLNSAKAEALLVQERTWQLLSRLVIRMPRLESPDETDWSAVVNNLAGVVRDSDLTTASLLRDRLVALAGDYSPTAARVNLTVLRRDTHTLLDPTIRRHQRGWQTLQGIHRRACDSVRAEITSVDDSRSIRLDRNAPTMELIEAVSGASTMVVSGESGVGKSALAVLGLSAEADARPDSLQALCVNLRHIPELAIELEATLGHPLSTLLGEFGAQQRILVVDGADAVAEDRHEAFRYLVSAAHDSGVKVLAVTSLDSKQVVLDVLKERVDTGVEEYVVPLLEDSEIDEIVATFSELEPLNNNTRSRELLRRLVVVDLLVRGQVSGSPLTDADAMNEVWSGLVRRREMSDRGFPDARETALLQLAELELDGGERFEVIGEIDPAGLDGLRRDGLLRTSPDAPFMIGPEFAHDEVRRYAVARLLLASGNPASRLLTAAAPRWSLAAARLACQAWLDQPDTSTMPMKGRFSSLQSSYDALADSGHGSRWGDVPGEALLTLTDPEPLLRDAWPDLLSDDAFGLIRLARLVDQRHRDVNGIVDISAVEPIVTILLEDPAPWRSGKHVEQLLRAWLRAHVVAGTGAGHPLRLVLRERLVEACAAGDRLLVERRVAAAKRRAKRTPEEIEHERQLAERHAPLFLHLGHGSRSRRPRPELPREITDNVFLELLALLGPDLGDDGEAILIRIARDAPARLGPAVDELFAGKALAASRRGLLGELTEAYYMDDEVEVSEIGGLDDGVRRHRGGGFGTPLAAWHRGPFIWLFQSDFPNGVRVLNRLLNHAARFRARTVTYLDRRDRALESDAASPYEIQLEVTGARRLYVGDEHVWRWYRGTGVGPYPCMSALQALEHVCDQLIEKDIPLRTLVPMLMDGCENLAMIGLIVGLLVRHLENSDRLLDSYFTEPIIWHQEFVRVVSESGGLAASSEGLAAPERRNWSFHEAAMFLVLRASGERIAELRALGETLVRKAGRLVAQSPDNGYSEKKHVSETTEAQLVVQARAWASSLDRDRYKAREAEQGVYIRANPPEDVARALQESHEDAELPNEAIRLFVRYVIDPKKEHAEPIGKDELVADIVTARKLLESPSSLPVHNPWDISALVAAAVLEAHLLDSADLPYETLSFAAEVVFRIGEGEAWPREFEFEGTFFDYGADRSAARVLPLLLAPVAAQLRAAFDEAEGWTTFERACRAGVNLARAVSYEVRLHLARGLDHVWETPCSEHDGCHHELGWRLATETMRDCILGPWDAETQQHSVVALNEPLSESLPGADDDSIVVSRLDAAIRALAPAAMADICISSQARNLLRALLDAQRRALLNYDDRDLDDRGSHTLVSARALLTLARDLNDAAIYEHIDAYADNPALLDKLLSALSAAAEETPDRAATARRLWPNVVRHVLQLDRSGRSPFRGIPDGDWALGSLIPNTTGELPYLYREVVGSPIEWYNPLELKFEVEAWLEPAAGSAECVDRLIGFIHALEPGDQVRMGLPWVTRLVAADPVRVARGSYTLPTWLIEMRSFAVDASLLEIWQRVVDDLVVAGVARLAPYSD